METATRAKKSHAGRKPITRDDIKDTSIYYKVINRIAEGNEHSKKVTLAWLTKSKIPYEDDKNKFYQKSWILKVINRLQSLGIVTIGKNGGYVVTPWHLMSNKRKDFTDRMWQDNFEVVDNSVYVWGDIIVFPLFKKECRPEFKDLASRITLEWTKWVFEQIESELRTVIKDKGYDFNFEGLAYIASRAGERVTDLLEELGWSKEFIEEIGVKETIAHIVHDSGLGLTRNESKACEMRKKLNEGFSLDKDTISYIEFVVLDKVFRRTKSSASPLIVIPIELPSGNEARNNLLDYLARVKKEAPRVCSV